jgi:hypothetical protein
MKRWKMLTVTAVLFLGLTTGAHSGGPWTVNLEGNGIISGGDLLDYGVIETDLVWNFKLNEHTGEVKGQVYIVEKLFEGGVRHFKLFGYEVYDAGDPNQRPVLFDCDDYEVRVQGIDDKGQEIAVHFRSKDNIVAPNTIWYWVKRRPDGNYITNTNDGLSVSNLFWMECR